MKDDKTYHIEIYNWKMTDIWFIFLEEMKIMAGRIRYSNAFLILIYNWKLFDFLSILSKICKNKILLCRIEMMQNRGKATVRWQEKSK